MTSDNNQGSKLKSFLDWVNAEKGLPPLEERDPGYEDHGHEDHGHDHGHEDHGDAGGSHADSGSEAEEAGQGGMDEELEYTVEIEGKAGKHYQLKVQEQDPAPATVDALGEKHFIPTKEQKKKVQALHFWYSVFAVLLAGALIAALLVTVANMPPFGNPDNPIHNEVSLRYVEQGLSETGATNTVAAMILDYRAFDTLGESIVLFTAVIFVIMLIRSVADPSGKKTDAPKGAGTALAGDGETRPLILRVVVMLAGPFIMIYGAYILLNGHLSPGGGFSAGAILGAGLSLYALAFGAEKVRTIFHFKTYIYLSCIALLFYALSKGYSFFMGASGLSTGIPLGTPGNILSAGLILPLNICVGIVVACTVYGLYALFSEGEV